MCFSRARTVCKMFRAVADPLSPSFPSLRTSQTGHEAKCRSKSGMLSLNIVPFRLLAATVLLVAVSHIVYPESFHCL